MNGISFSDGNHLTDILNERLQNQRSNPSVRQKLDYYVDETKGSMTFWIGSFQMKCNEEAR